MNTVSLLPPPEGLPLSLLGAQTSKQLLHLLLPLRVSVGTKKTNGVFIKTHQPQNNGAKHFKTRSDIYTRIIRRLGGTLEQDASNHYLLINDLMICNPRKSLRTKRSD